MKIFSQILFSIIFVLTSANQALAFNFGFVRVPDWMDFYILLLACATGISWIGLLITKPRGVPTNQLSKVRISPLANFFRFALLASFMIMMAMVFIGMGMRRFSEA